LAATDASPALVTSAQPVRELASVADDAAVTAAPIEWDLQVAMASQGSSATTDAWLSMPERVALLPGLRRLTLRAPKASDASDAPGTSDTSASMATYTLTSLREFTQTQPLYTTGADGSLIDHITGTVYRPDDREGFFVSAQGERLQPGYRVNVGWTHYAQVFSEGKFREPFVSVLAWTVVFSALSVIGAGGLGLLLAVLLNWEGLRGREIYRLVLFLPYAVPGFISILVFKGLFNQNLGEINLILHGLFGLRPAWFSDPLLAKAMLLIVNVWLGFPYMMVLCSGLIKSIPSDLYEASAVVGAGPITNFWRITLPLILKPLTPLLISAFAFNFNNFVLISLLTGGRPDQLDTALPAGTTDILVSYTWRIAFQDSGQQFGLAAAISTVIFLIVAAITLVQMRFTRVASQEGRA
jgi:maltose/maltodextrin transport system permease protein